MKASRAEKPRISIETGDRVAEYGHIGFPGIGKCIQVQRRSLNREAGAEPVAQRESQAGAFDEIQVDVRRRRIGRILWKGNCTAGLNGLPW